MQMRQCTPQSELSASLFPKVLGAGGGISAGNNLSSTAWRIGDIMWSAVQFGFATANGVVLVSEKDSIWSSSAVWTPEEHAGWEDGGFDCRCSRWRTVHSLEGALGPWFRVRGGWLHVATGNT